MFEIRFSDRTLSFDAPVTAYDAAKAAELISREVLAAKIKNCGAMFLGNYSPEPLGDYFAGPNHTLPTSGTARFFSPLNTGDFYKKMSVINYNEETLKDVYKEVAACADSEGLGCHAAAVRARFED